MDRRTFLHGIGGVAATAGAGAKGLAAIATAPRPLDSAGRALSPGDPGYESKRTSLVWQAIKPAGRPHRIYRCESAADVSAVVAAARRDRRRISVVSGGHSYIGNALVDGVALIDLGAMAEVSVDPGSRRATLGPAVRAFDLDARLAEQGLVFPVAHNPTVGVGGYLLGGGMGWNAESFGNLACFNIRAIDAVLASGERVRADAAHHPDLLWAARGGGPLFPAIVTGFHVDVFKRPAAIRETTYVYPIAALEPLADWLEVARRKQDPKVDFTVIIASGDPAQGAPPGLQLVVSIVCFTDSAREAQSLLAAIAAGAPPSPLFKEELTPRTIADLLLADKAGAPTRHSVQTLWTDSPRPALLAVAAAMQAVPSKQSLAYLNYRARPTVPANGAYSRLGQAFVYVDAIWDDPVGDAANRRWADGLIASLDRLDVGAYVNETEFLRNPGRLRDCFGGDALRRLAEVARRYDPEGLFVRPVIA